MRIVNFEKVSLGVVAACLMWPVCLDSPIRMMTLPHQEGIVSSADRPFRIGRIAVVGASHFSAKDLIHICGVKEGATVKSKALESGAARIKDAYLKEGYTEVEVSVRKDTELDGSNRTVNIKISVGEGRRYFITRIEFIGNNRTRHRIAQRAAGINLGPYDPRRIRDWIDGLNRLGRFKMVSREDLEIKIDEEKQNIWVTFHVEERD
jgi:outer membrane protein insertion porin family